MKGVLILGFGLAVMAQSVEAKSSVLSVATSTDRGSHVVVKAGSKWKSKPVVVELGVKKKKTWKWSRLASSRTDKLGIATVCSSRTLNAGNQMRVKSGSKVISTIKISRTVTLSGCGYVPPQAQFVDTPVTTVAVSVPAPTTVPPTTVPPTTVPPTTTTTTTTLPPPTPAPTALALSAATDTGDSQSDGITKADALVVIGSAQANSSVQVYVNGIISGSACIADGSGAFSCSLGTVTEGTKSVTAKAAGTNGESVASQTLTVVVDRTKPTVSWSPHGNIWGGANEDFPFTFTISELTTTLSFQDVRLLCSVAGLCEIGSFSGSGVNYSVTFSTIDNFANGGAIGLFADSFSDVAGNTNDASNGATIMFDTSGPQATLSYDEGYMYITFSEIPIGFNQSSLEIIWFYQGMRYPDGTIIPGSGLSNFRAAGTSGRVWRFIISDYYTVPNGDDTYQIEVKTLMDVDGNYSSPALLNWP
jgi:hypothetical protein